MKTDYCYIEFKAIAGNAFDRLNSLLERIKGDLAKDQRPESEWYTFFRDKELDAFWWPNQSQLEETKSRWGDVPIRVSQQKSNEQTDWDIYSMFEIISTSEYTLLGLKPLGNSIYHLAFKAEVYPYGGTESLQKMIRAFGFNIIAIEDGTGRIEI